MSNSTPERDERSQPTRELPSPATSADATGGAPTTQVPTAQVPTAQVPAAHAPTDRPTSTGSRISDTPVATEPRPGPPQDRPAEPEPGPVKGPYLSTVILGIVCLAVAGLVFAQEVAGISIDWGNVGPLGIVLAGAVLVVLGTLGLVASRRRH
jgi:hypothetical protein